VTRTIRLHIEELVLHSFDPHDRHAIADAVQRELSTLVATHSGSPDSASSFSVSAERARVDAGSFHAERNAKPNSIGAQIARAVHGGITK